MIRTKKGEVEMNGRESELLTDMTMIIIAYKDEKEKQGYTREFIQKLILKVVDTALRIEEEIEAESLKLEEEMKKEGEQLLPLLSEEDEHNLMKMISVLGGMN